MDIKPYFRDLQVAVRKLEESRGRRIARKNARKGFLKVLAELRKVLDDYPVIGKDGKEQYSIRRGVRCPSCGAICRSVGAFCNHWGKKHGGPHWPVIQCACGGRYDISIAKSHKSFIAHINGLKDLETHFIMGAIARLGQGSGG